MVRTPLVTYNGRGSRSIGARLEQQLVAGTSDDARTRRTRTVPSYGGSREWNEAERVLFAETLLLFPLALGALQMWWLVDHPETAPYLDPHVLRLLAWAATAFLCRLAVILPVGLAVRSAPRARR